MPTRNERKQEQRAEPDSRLSPPQPDRAARLGDARRAFVLGDEPIVLAENVRLLRLEQESALAAERGKTEEQRNLKQACSLLVKLYSGRVSPADVLLLDWDAVDHWHALSGPSSEELNQEWNEECIANPESDAQPFSLERWKEVRDMLGKAKKRMRSKKNKTKKKRAPSIEHELSEFLTESEMKTLEKIEFDASDLMEEAAAACASSAPSDSDQGESVETVDEYEKEKSARVVLDWIRYGGKPGALCHPTKTAAERAELRRFLRVSGGPNRACQFAVRPGFEASVGRSPLLREHYSLLQVAASWRRLDAIEFLLEEGADPAYVNPQGHYVLDACVAIFYMPYDDPIDERLIRTLVEAGAPVNVPLRTQSWDGQQVEGEVCRPLFTALHHWRVGAVRALLEHGADPNARFEGCTALAYAARKGCLLAVKELLFPKHCPDVNARAQLSEGWTPLLLACMNPYEPGAGSEVPECPRKERREMCRLLLQHKADIDAQSLRTGNTALMFACRHGDHEMVRMLLDHGADPEITAGEEHHEEPEGMSLGMRAIYIAVAHSGALQPDRAQQGVRCLQHLIAANVNLEADACFGKSALHCAMIADSPLATIALIKAGAQLPLSVMALPSLTAPGEPLASTEPSSDDLVWTITWRRPSFYIPPSTSEPVAWRCLKIVIDEMKRVGERARRRWQRGLKLLQASLRQTRLNEEASARQRAVREAARLAAALKTPRALSKPGPSGPMPKNASTAQMTPEAPGLSARSKRRGQRAEAFERALEHEEELRQKEERRIVEAEQQRAARRLAFEIGGAW